MDATPSLPTDAAAPATSAHVQRHVWHSRFGDIVIEVRDGAAFVNGDRVEPVAQGDRPVPISPAQQPA